MASPTYRAIRQAILAERQITCHYNGQYRELCPHILGHTDGEEKLLAFQFGGESSKPLPRGGEWRCFRVAGMRDVATRVGHGMREARIARRNAAWRTSISISTSTSVTSGEANR
jgi:hypothetical protein